MNKLSPIIEPAELAALAQSGAVILIDASTGSNAEKEYSDRHLAGALYVDLERDLAAVPENFSDGGRHPLPSAEDFGSLLERLGITPESHVIVYDNKSGANAAARFWWMLRAAGHEKVQVLNGGFDAAVAAGFPVSSSSETPNPAQPYPFTDWSLPLVTIDEVETAAGNPDYVVVDVREKMRYDGIIEPIDLIAGHIPGAINIPWQENLDSSGKFLSPDTLHEKYTKNLTGRPAENVVVHCGSGVTACHTLLALEYAGLGIPSLYVGSWSEWSRSNKRLAGGTIDI